MDTREHIHDPGKDSDFLARRERALVLKEKKIIVEISSKLIMSPCQEISLGK